MSPMRIWHLNVLSVYVAVALAFGVALARATDGEAFLLGLFVAELMLLGLAGLMYIVVRPGPHRDWLVMSCVSLTFYLIALMGAAPIPVLAWRGDFSGGPGFGGKQMLQVGLLAGLLCALFLFFAIKATGTRRCPGCGRPTLLESAARNRGGDGALCRFCCTTCEKECSAACIFHRPKSLREALLKDAKTLVETPPCPHCERPTLKRIPYTFYWCLACRSRYKRRRKGEWEYAGQPDDDRFYSLWDGREWLAGLVRRSTERSDRPDPPAEQD